MNFEKIKLGFLNGKKQKIFFKDGTNIFTYEPPLSLYNAILEQEPSIEKYYEPNGANPLFYVNSLKKFNRLVEHGFDIYKKDNEGIGLDSILHPSIFINLSDKALLGFKSKDKEFLEFYSDRLGYGGATAEPSGESSREPSGKTSVEPAGISSGKSGAEPVVEYSGETSLFLHSKMLGHHPELDNTSVHTPHNPNYSWVFTTDARNEFKTFTTKEGYDMLEELARKIQPVLSELRATPGFSEEKGFKIYTQKENLKSGATWSDEEYADPSFLYQYCLNKAMQRFPESIEMMNAAFQLGIFEGMKQKSFTVVSLGGGCSYELLAVKAIFEKYIPGVKLRLVSLDYEPLWGKIVKPLGIEFDQIDFNKPVAELKKQLDPYKADFYVMSFVYRTYIQQKHRDFITYLCKSTFGIFINDRNTEYLTFDMMSYKLSNNGFLTLISNEYEGYPYVKALTTNGYPDSIYKDTPWSNVGVVRKSGNKKTK